MPRSPVRCYCTNLRRACTAVSTLYDERLAPIGVTAGQFSLLRGIARLETCNVSELAADLGLERTTLVRTLKPLIERGLVQDLSAPGQRDRRLHLTAAGEDALCNGAPLWQSAQEEIARRIGEDQLPLLLSLLHRLEGE